MQIFHLVYHSRATYDLQSEDLSKILSSSKRQNLKNEISGFLVYRDNYFLQLLEGTEANVYETLDRIKKDPRHASIQVIGEYLSEDRIVLDWNMALVDSKGIANSARGLIELFEVAREGRVFDTQDALKLLLKKFSKDATILQEY